MIRVSWLFVVFVLAACSSKQGPGRISDPHTGRHLVRSEMFIAGRTGLSTLAVKVMILGKADNKSHVVMTYLARSDLNYPKIDAVWSYGTRMAYRKFDRQRAHRLRVEVGAIALSRDAFQDYGETGFAFRMYGRRGVYDAVLPGRLFRQVLALDDG